MDDKCIKCSKEFKDGGIIYKFCCSEYFCFHCARNIFFKFHECSRCKKRCKARNMSKNIYKKDLKGSNEKLTECPKNIEGSEQQPMQSPSESFTLQTDHGEMEEILKELKEKVEQGETRERELALKLEEALRESLTLQNDHNEMQKTLKEKLEQSETRERELALKLEEALKKLEQCSAVSQDSLKGTDASREASANRSDEFVAEIEEREQVDVLVKNCKEVLLKLSKQQPTIKPSISNRLETLMVSNSDGNSIEEFKLRTRVDVLEEKLRNVFLELAKEVKKSTDLTVEIIRLMSLLSQFDSAKPTLAAAANEADSSGSIRSSQLD